VKQQLAAVRMLFDWLITGQVMPANPASSVRGPKISFMSRPRRDSIEIPRHIWERMENALAYAA